MFEKIAPPKPPEKGSPLAEFEPGEHVMMKGVWFKVHSKKHNKLILKLLQRERRPEDAD